MTKFPLETGGTPLKIEDRNTYGKIGCFPLNKIPQPHRKEDVLDLTILKVFHVWGIDDDLCFSLFEGFAASTVFLISVMLLLCLSWTYILISACLFTESFRFFEWAVPIYSEPKDFTEKVSVCFRQISSQVCIVCCAINIPKILIHVQDWYITWLFDYEYYN